jgi:hypothetical protein
MQNLAARIGAVFYLLWGVVHVIGGAFQVATLRRNGGSAFVELVSSGTQSDVTSTIPVGGEAFMAMGAANIAVAGALVAAVAVLNWRNDRTAYWVNLFLVTGTDLSLLGFLLVPGVMSWSDGIIGLALFVPAALLTTVARFGKGFPPKELEVMGMKSVVRRGRFVGT